MWVVLVAVFVDKHTLRTKHTHYSIYIYTVSNSFKYIWSGVQSYTMAPTKHIYIYFSGMLLILSLSKPDKIRLFRFILAGVSQTNWTYFSYLYHSSTFRHVTYLQVQWQKESMYWKYKSKNSSLNYKLLMKISFNFIADTFFYLILNYSCKIFLHLHYLTWKLYNNIYWGTENNFEFIYDTNVGLSVGYEKNRRLHIWENSYTYEKIVLYESFKIFLNIFWGKYGSFWRVIANR